MSRELAVMTHVHPVIRIKLQYLLPSNSKTETNILKPGGDSMIIHDTFQYMIIRAAINAGLSVTSNAILIRGKRVIKNITLFL